MVRTVLIEIAVVHTPIDALTLAAKDGRLCLLHFGARESAVRATLQRWYPGETIERRRDPGGAATALAKYFSGQFDILETIQVEFNGTPFQQKVWRRMAKIPYGQMMTYGALAQAVGSAPRAIGGACGRNPIAIILPCHRVIGGSGALTGYSGAGGVSTKQYLLELEGAVTPHTLDATRLSA